MLIKNKKIIKIIRLFLVLSLIACWISISSTFDDLLIFEKNTNLNFKELINFLRHISIYICFLFTITVFIFFREKIHFKKYFIFYFLTLYFISQIFGLLFTDNSINNISFIVSALSTIFTIILLDAFLLNNEKKKLLFIVFIILLGVFFVTFIPTFLAFLKGETPMYGYFFKDGFLDKSLPRSSGLGRIVLIILILIEFFEFNFLKKKSYQLIFIKIIFLSIIFTLQSRTNIFLAVISYLFIFYNKEKFNIFNFIKFITIYFMIPIFLFFLFTSFNSYKKSQQINGENLSIIQHLDSEEFNILRSIPEDNFSSGRVDDWKKILSKIDGKNIIYGYGAQGDRYLINQTASNALVYAYACSGIVGLIFLIFFLIIVGYQITKIILYNFGNNFNNILLALIVIIISLRGILETSFAVFSIDFIILITAFIYIFDKKISLNEIKIKYLK